RPKSVTDSSRPKAPGHLAQGIPFAPCLTCRSQGERAHRPCLTAVGDGYAEQRGARPNNYTSCSGDTQPVFGVAASPLACARLLQERSLVFVFAGGSVALRGWASLRRDGGLRRRVRSIRRSGRRFFGTRRAWLVLR